MNIQDKFKRTCVVCKKKSIKYDLIRFIKSKRSILFDSKMVMSGRGAYICKTETCVLASVTKKRLCYSLKISIEHVEWDKILLDVNSVI